MQRPPSHPQAGSLPRDHSPHHTHHHHPQQPAASMSPRGSAHSPAISGGAPSPSIQQATPPPAQSSTACFGHFERELEYRYCFRSVYIVAFSFQFCLLKVQVPYKLSSCYHVCLSVCLIVCMYLTN